MIVPSLLKRWNRLESGFDASALAYKELTRHYKDKVRGWYDDDQKAQADRQKSPEAMDIYDTVKDKGMDLIRISVPLTNAHMKFHLAQPSSNSSRWKRNMTTQSGVRHPGYPVELRFRKCSKFRHILHV
jgi:hypothetical protein